MRAVPLVLLACLLLAACGGSGGHTGAAHCLTQAIEYYGPGICRTHKYDPYVRIGGRLVRGGRGAEVTSASCVNQVGNEYTCTVAMDDGATNTYQVTYDGSQIAFSQTSSSGGITVPTTT